MHFMNFNKTGLGKFCFILDSNKLNMLESCLPLTDSKMATNTA